MNFFEKIKIKKEIKKKFSQLFINAKLNHKSDKIILLEFNHWTFNHIAASYVCDVLAKKCKARIDAYPGYQLMQSDLDQNFLQKLLWQVGNFFSLKTFGIHHSFGVKNIFWPKINKQIKTLAVNEFNNYKNIIKSKKDLENYKINGILIGDLIYDSFLKKKMSPTIDIDSTEFIIFFLDSIKLFFFWENYFKKKKISAVVSFHSVYLSALPLRFAIANKVPSYVLNLEKFYNLNNKRIFIGLEYLDYRKIFKFFSKKNKIKYKKFAEKKLIERFNGLLSSDTIYMSKTPYGKINNKSILKKSNKIKILIAPSSFSDSPHCFGNNLFTDHYEWLENLGKISNSTDYDWYIKCHPDFASYFDNTISIVKKYTKKFPNINYLNAKSSHNQLVREGIDYVLTVYGTIAGEYPFFGINVINASVNHTQAKYNFTITPKNQKEYIWLIKNLKKPKKINKINEILEHQYMKHEYFDNSWFFNDLNKVKYSINGYINFTRLNMYQYWVNNFDINLHDLKYNSIKKFVDSGNYILVNK